MIQRKNMFLPSAVLLVYLLGFTGILTGQLQTTMALTGTWCDFPEAPDNGLVLVPYYCIPWSRCEEVLWRNDKQLEKFIECLGEDCWAFPSELNRRRAFKYAFLSCDEGYLMSCDSDAITNNGKDSQSASTGVSTANPNTCETSYYGLIRCQDDGTWSTSIRCLPIISVGSPITTGLPPTSSAGVTTDSSSAATSTTEMTNTVTSSPKTTEPSTTTVDGVTTDSNLAATKTARTTRAERRRPTVTTTVMTGFSKEPRSTFFGDVTTMTNVEGRATSNGSPSYTPTIKVTTMVPSTTEASVTYARNTSTRTANYPQTPTLSITSEVSSSPAKITGTPTSVSRITHTFVNETPAVTTPSHVSTGTNPGKPKMTTGWVQNTFHASSGKSVETTVVETTVEGHTAVPTKEKAETVSFSESSFTTRPASDKINYTTAAPRTIVLSIPTTTSGTTGDTGSAPTGSDQRSDRTDSTTTMQQFDRTIANTETVSNPTVGNTNISTTEVNSQKTPMPTKESTHSTAGQRPSQYLSSKTRSAKPFTTVTMKSTVHTTISFQDLRLSTPKMFTTSSSLTASRNDIMTTTISSTELVITSPPTEQTLQYKTSPKENNTSTQKSQGHQMHDDKTADGMIIYIALVSGIAAAVGIAILIPLFVFVLKSLCTAAKVAPDAGLFEGSANEYVVNGNERTTHMMTHV